jgi:hypothetical protein
VARVIRGSRAERRGPRGDRVLQLLDEIQDKGNAHSGEHDDARSSQHR